jgi:methyl-accepting chemotaxis protein
MSSETRDSAPAREGTDVARRLLVAVSALAIVGTVLGLLLVQRIGTTYRDGLEVARDSALVASTSTASVERLAADVSKLAASAATSLEQATTVVDSAAESAADIGTAFGTNVADALDGTASIANRLASVIETIERFIPGNSASLAEDLRTLADGLAPLPDQLRDLGSQLSATSTELQTASTNLADVADQLDQLAASIDAATEQIVSVDALAQDIADRADRALNRSSTDLWLLRLLVVVLGLGTLAACVAAHRAVGELARRDAATTGNAGTGGTAAV